MTVFSVFTLFGGLAFFLYGMYVMSNGLEKMTGGKLESTLKKMTSNPFKGFVLGAGITIAIQSSSAMTVMLVGLVNSGIMELGQTVSVIMGSNVGTTLTAWVLSLAGIESDNFFLQLLNPSSFSPIIALVGIILVMTAKNNGKRRDIGTAMLGFSILMYGMELMSQSVSPLADSPEFSKFLILFKNPILGVLLGAGFTGIIQSSAASVGIMQALSMTGSVTYGVALPIIMGQNIGTCVTALLSSIGTNKNAKRVAAVHVYFNIIGTVVFTIAILIIQLFTTVSFLDNPVGPVGIALMHSVFNVASTLILLPFSKQLELLARKTVKDKNEPTSYEFLDERLLQTPFSALAKCESSSVEMSKLAHNALTLAISELSDYTDINATIVNENENTIDVYEDKLGSYLVKLSAQDLSHEEGQKVALLLHSIGDFERISDHAVNILEAAKELHDKNVSFSESAMSDIKVISDAVMDISLKAVKAFENDDITLAKTVEPLEQVIDDLKEDVLDRHIQRLQQGQCTIQLGFILSDLVTNLERVSDHCSNIAARVIKTETENFELHNYVSDMKLRDRDRYNEQYDEYKRLYSLA